MNRYLIPLIALLFACAADRRPGELFGPAEDDIIVVDAQLIVGDSLPPIYLSRTLAPSDTYTAAASAITGALVALRQDEQLYPYTDDPAVPGRYLPPVSAPILPAALYQLDVLLDDGRQVSAHTRTPKRLVIKELLLLNEETLVPERNLKLFADVGDAVYDAPENQIIYQQGLVEAVLETEFDIPAYQLAIFNLEEDSELLVDAEFIEEDDFQDFERQGASPPLSVREGQARLPWFAIAFAGRHKFKIYAVDKNWFDFIRTDPDEDGGSFGGLLGDQFQRPAFNIEGGIGLFASASVDSVGFTILPKADQ